MANSQADNGNESDADDISYKSSSSSSSSSVSFDSSSESSSSSHHDGATHHQDDGHVANHNHATVISCSPSFTSHLLSPPPLVSSRIDTPLQQQQQQQQDQQLIQQQYHSYSSFQSPPTSFRPRSRSTSSFSSPLVIHHPRQNDTSHISPLASSMGMESNSTFAATVASVPATGITNNQVPLSSSSSRRNSIVSLVEPSEYVAGPGVDFYPPDTRPLSRPRSNTRRNSTSTPIRNATPVLGPVNRSTLAASEVSSSSSSSLLDPSYRRNNSSGRSRGVGGGTTTPTSAGRSRVNSATSPRLVGLGANLAVGTVLPSAGNVYGSSSLSVLRERSRRMGHSTGDHPSQSRSCKQGPGHRKVRRWNNDLFIGIAKDISCSHARNPQRGARIANIYAEAEMDKAKYTMPHVPSHRWTVFRALMEGASHGNGTSSTTSKDGTVRVGSMEQEQEQEQDDDDWELGRKSFQERQGLLLDPTHVARVRERFLQGEVSTFDGVGGGNGVMSEATELRLRKRQENLFQNGHLMMQCNVNKRLLNIVTRTCRMPGFSRKVVDAFEFVLVENMSMDVTKNDRQNNIQQDCDEVWEQVLVQKPFITTRKIASNKNNTHEKSPVIVRMIFSEDGSRAAFHRLLLHAVCQFHGLEVSSSTTSKGHKMLTVTGLCKGSHLRFLEFVPFDDECDGDHPNHAAAQNHQSSHQACLVSGMSTLQVQ